MATTTVAPIITEQINQNFYVGFGSLQTIQDAVDAAVESGLPSLVIIPQGYGGTDQISDVVNGTDYIYLTDQRGSSPFFYLWYNGKYQGPAVNLTGELPGNTTLNLNNFHFVITGTMPPVSGNGANASGVLSIGATNGQDTTGIAMTGGKGAVTAVWAGHGGSAPAGGTNGAGGDLYLLAGYGGRGLGATGTPGNVYIQDEENAPANVNSGNTFIGGHDQQHATMIQRNGNLYAPNLTAGNATFNTALVDGSPVRTFENTGDPGTGATYPPAGLAVSTGSGWGNSIDPSTLTPFPPSGIAVSTGSAWGSPIDPSTLATTAQLAGFIPLSGGTVTGNLSVNGSLAAGSLSSAADIGAAGTVFAGALSTTGPANIVGNITSNGAIGAPAALIGEISAFGWEAWNNANTITTIGINQTTSEPWIRLFNRNAFWTQTGFAITAAADGSVSFRSGNDTNSYPYTWFYLTRQSSGEPLQVVFNCGVSISGDLNITGAKNFRIEHPTDSTKTLTHSALEGPESALFYRGEAKTTNGIAEITLPDYFEALTLKDQRTVQVTPLIEEDNASFGACAATRVSNGKFRVCSTTNSQGFYWEVKAIRADIPPLEVISDRDSAGNTTAKESKKTKRS